MTIDLSNFKMKVASAKRVVEKSVGIKYKLAIIDK